MRRRTLIKTLTGAAAAFALPGLALSQTQPIKIGLATDYCVAYSALDAVRKGFEVTVRLDACRAIDLGGSLEVMTGRMRDAGVTLA